MGDVLPKFPGCKGTQTFKQIALLPNTVKNGPEWSGS